MVAAKHCLVFSAITVVLFLLPPPLRAATQEPLLLDQQKVAQIVLDQGRKTKEVLLGYQLRILAPISAYSSFEWKSTAELGYQMDNSQTFQFLADYRYDKYLGSVGLSKLFTSGTSLTVQVQRTARSANYGVYSTITTPVNLTEDAFSMKIEQSIWNNWLGKASQASLDAATYEYQAANRLKGDDLQSVVLASLKTYWGAYVAQLNLKQALSTREGYQKLVAAVRRKSGLGYANPGELTQVLAELENREKEVKEASHQYLTAVENLLTELDLAPDTDISFDQSNEVPSLPKFQTLDIEKLRQMEAQKLRLKSAQIAAKSANWDSDPSLSLVAQYLSTGVEESPSDSLRAVLSGSRPQYYVGLKFQQNFGFGVKNETALNKEYQRELEEIKLARLREESTDKEKQLKRSVEIKHHSVLTAEKVKNLRKETVAELHRTFQQGRTDISLLIDSMNRQYAAETLYTQAVGDYNMALAEWLAFSNQLIPDEEKRSPL